MDRGVVCRWVSGRAGKAKGRNPVMDEGGQSDGPVLPEKRPNNAQGGAAEVVEGRGSAKENADSAIRPGRSGDLSVSGGLGRVRRAAQ